MSLGFRLRNRQTIKLVTFVVCGHLIPPSCLLLLFTPSLCQQSELLLCLAIVAMTITVLARYDYPSASQISKMCKQFSSMCEMARLQLSSFCFTIIACILAIALGAVQVVALLDTRLVRGRYVFWHVLAGALVVCAFLGFLLLPVSFWAHSSSYPKGSEQVTWFVLQLLSVVFALVALGLNIYAGRHFGRSFQIL